MINDLCETFAEEMPPTLMMFYQQKKTAAPVASLPFSVLNSSVAV